MKVTKKMKELLEYWGYSKTNIKQIEETLPNMRFIHVRGYDNIYITAETAKKNLGIKEFTSGIGRATFHQSGCQSRDGYMVHFWVD